MIYQNLDTLQVPENADIGSSNVGTSARSDISPIFDRSSAAITPLLPGAISAPWMEPWTHNLPLQPFQLAILQVLAS